MKANWQKVPAIPVPKWRDGFRDLTLYSVNAGTRHRFFPFLADGTADPDASFHLAQSMADKHTGTTHPPHPRLLKLLYRLAVRFNARQINIISGYRDPADALDKESHHADGSAIDIMIPGVPLPALAKVARSYGHVGVGFYPTSGFIHLDVRSGPSYFWVDPSGPGKPSCYRRILAAEGAAFDRKWKPERDEPIPSRTARGNLLGTPAAEAEKQTKVAAKKKKKTPSAAEPRKKLVAAQTSSLPRKKAGQVSE